MRQGCAIEYELAKRCNEQSYFFQPQVLCSQECGSNANGCIACGACPSSAVQLGPYGPKGSSASTEWDGYWHVDGVFSSSSGCGCYIRGPAGSGPYLILVTGFLTSDDALSQKNGYTFTTIFDYPPPDGIVHVKLDFKGL